MLEEARIREHKLHVWLSASFALATAACRPPVELTFEERAREFVGGVGWLDPEVPVALAENGLVAFAAATAETSFTTRDPAMFAADAMSVTRIPLAPGGYSLVRTIQIISDGSIAFAGRRQVDGAVYGGVYRSTASAAPITTLYEGLDDFDPDTAPPAQPFVALAEDGTFAYSSIQNGSGAVHRGELGGATMVLRAGSGVFYNTKELDVNEAGEVAVQMEYTDPTKGLSRGILIFDSPGDDLSTIVTAVEKLGVGEQPAPAENSGGTVAFALDSPATLRFYDPPNDASGTLVAELTLEPGVYVSEPTAFGVPPILKQIANTSGPYESFGRVQINGAGVVVFEAAVDSGFSGIFTGADPDCNRIVGVGDELGDHLFSVVRLGELNDSGEVAVLTRDYNTTDRQVWVVGGLPSNAALARSSCYSRVIAP